MELRLRCRDAGGRRKGGFLARKVERAEVRPARTADSPLRSALWSTEYGMVHYGLVCYISEPSTGQLHPVPRMPSPQGPTLYGRFAQRSVIGLRGGSTPGTS